ncbi:MAG: FAD-binding protein [Anaerolineales bacterium]|nr:FAD-binding protein [Anaerolineales bacterium]
MNVLRTPNAEVLRDLEHRLQQREAGETRFDPYTRAMYNSDGSIHQVPPLGVVYPRTGDDLCAIVEIAGEFDVPVLPRGAGSSLAGQAVGAALVVDCGRHLTHIRRLDPEARSVEVEPGVVGLALNRHAAQHGLMFGPDPASLDRATFGGMIGNNSTGMHSIRYGMTGDHVLSLEAVLSDGSTTTFAPMTTAAAQAQAQAAGRAGAVYAAALALRVEYAEAIRGRWPRVWRRASGYSLHYLINYSASQPPGWYAPGTPYPPAYEFNLAPVLAGSEGTLALFRSATVRLVPRPKHTVLVVLPFQSAGEACDAIPTLVGYGAAAIELLPAELIAQARKVPAYARHVTFTDGTEAALLVAEFTGDTPAEALAAAQPMAAMGGRILEAPAAQADLWAVRRGGMGIIMNVTGDLKPVDFIEDVSVPIERLGEYVRAADKICAAHGTGGVWYAHASAGCLHFRPMLNLNTAAGRADLRGIATEIAALTVRLGGALSGEHGDGLSRSEFVEQIYGPELTTAFGRLKAAFDPDNRLNPGKVLPLPETRVERDLRTTPDPRLLPMAPVFSFHREGGFAAAIDGCVGAGVCRQENGVMCPSFQATRDEWHLTRGRANALRAALSGQLPKGALTSKQMYQVLDLCVECKGCKGECPTGVDMAHIKSEFLNYYQAEHGVPLRSRFFGEIAWVSRMVRPFAGLVNALNRFGPTRALVSRVLGVAPRRTLPSFVSRTFRQWFNGRAAAAGGAAREVVLFVDTYTDANCPHLGQAAVRVLEAAGCRVTVVAQQACCGRPMISKGLLQRAKQAAAHNLAALAPYAERGVPIVGLEPSCILTLREEYVDFFPPPGPGAQLDAEAGRLAGQAAAVAGVTFLIEEYLTAAGPDGARPVDRLRFKPQAQGKPWLFHGHCHAKSLVGTAPTLALLRATGAEVREIASGCCGMAGSFGYEAEHYELSLQIGELKLFPAVRAGQAASVPVTASGTSCRAQILDGTGAKAVHPVEMLAELMA